MDEMAETKTELDIINDDLSSESVSLSDICVDIPMEEDVAFKAVRWNDLTTIQRRLHEGFDINAKHEAKSSDKVYEIRDWTRMIRQIRLKRYSLLHVAVIHGKIETIQLLLSHGANVNLVDDTHRSPISVAAAIQRPDVVALLIKEGADINIQSISGRTPLIEGISNNTLSIVKLLIDAGADLDLTDTKGTTPLFSCLTTSKTMNLDIIRALLKGGCSINLANKQGATPLMMAVGLGRIDAAKILLEAGADINQVDKQGKNALHLAAGVKTALFLINNGASSDFPDKHGVRPIDRAAQVGHIGMLRLLLGSDCQRSLAILDVPRVVQAQQSLPVFDKWLQNELHNPRELKRLCRQTIRQTLSPFNTARICDLPVPSLVKDYLLAKQLDFSFDTNVLAESMQNLATIGGAGGHFFAIKNS